MIDFNSITLTSFGEYFKDFPSRFIFTGDAYRAYKFATPTSTTSLKFYFKTPPDKSMFLFFRELVCRKDNVLYKVMVGGQASGGTNIPIYNKNQHFQNTKISGCVFKSGVTFSGTMTQIDAEPAYGAVDVGGRSSGGLTIDNNYRILMPNTEFFIEISTTSGAIDGEVKLELQWVEL